MAHVTTDDGVKLYYEEAGAGIAIIFVHEFAGDYRSYEPQMRYFSRRYRCVAYNARGYPPSDVPAETAQYSQARACDDIRAVLDGLGIDSAHVVGISMGGFATLHFGMRYGERARSLVIGGCGYGAEKGTRAQFQDEAEHAAQMFERSGMAEGASRYALGATRVQLQNKDPRGWREFATQMATHSALGSANTLRGVQMKRPTIYSLESKLRALKVPLHMISGDEDSNCIDPSLFIKRVCPSAWLTIFPATGHAVNLEEVDLFNRITGEFLAQIDSGRWRSRDPRSFNKSNLLKK